MSPARAGRPRPAASIRSSTICRPRRARPTCWRWSRRSTPIPPCTAFSCNCRCRSTSIRRGCWKRSRRPRTSTAFIRSMSACLSIGDTSRALIPCTPAGAMILIDRACERLGWSLPGMEAVIIGRSNIVGKPMAQLLLARHCTVTIAHSRTLDLPAVARRADILVAAVGRPEMVRGELGQARRDRDRRRHQPRAGRRP